MALKVLYITMQFPVPSETFAAVELRALRAQQVQVAVSTFKLKPPNCATVLRERGIENFDIEHNSLFNMLRGLWISVSEPKLPLRLLRSLSLSDDITLITFLKSLALIPRSLDLFDKIRRTPLDVVHLYWGHYPSLLGLLVHDLLRDIPVSLSLSAYDLHSRYGPSMELGKTAPLIFTLAKSNVPELKELGFDEDRIHVVYHGVDVGAQKPQQLDKQLANIVIAERLIPLKCTADSLRVFRKVLDKRPDAILTLMGDGPDRERLTALADDLELGKSIHFTGHVKHDDVLSCLESSKVLLSMSSSERLPNTVKEAMLRDCIPVVARTPGIEELIDHGSTGFIVEQGEIDAAAEAVLTCLEGWEQLKAVRASARSHISSCFNSLTLADRRHRLWRQVLEERRNSQSI